MGLTAEGRRAKAREIGYEIYEAFRDHDDIDSEGGWWTCSCGEPLVEDDGGYEPEEVHEAHQYECIGGRVLRLAKRLAKGADW